MRREEQSKKRELFSMLLPKFMNTESAVSRKLFVRTLLEESSIPRSFRG